MNIFGGVCAVIVFGSAFAALAIEERLRDWYFMVGRDSRSLRRHARARRALRATDRVKPLARGE
jgi:hypothetical protein